VEKEVGLQASGGRSTLVPTIDAPVTCRVERLGSWVLGVEFGVLSFFGLEFQVWGPAVEVGGLGIQGSGFRVKDVGFGFWGWDLGVGGGGGVGFWVQGLGLDL